MLRTVACAAALFSSASFAQRDFSSVEIKAEKAGEGTYVLYGAGGNIGLHFGEDAVFLVDDQFAPLTDKILAKVEELAGRGPDFVLSTHYHGDHVGAMGEVMAADPMRVLVGPRVVACVLMIPVLTVVSNLCGVGGGSRRSR